LQRERARAACGRRAWASEEANEAVVEVGGDRLSY
jgi:hypothetical protein